MYSDDNCYLWYLATKHKLHRKQANAATVWAAIKHAHQQHYRHIYFMDVGLPFKKINFVNSYLDSVANQSVHTDGSGAQ